MIEGVLIAAGSLFILGLLNTFGIAFNGSRWPFSLGFSLHRLFFDWARYGDEVWFSTMSDERQLQMLERYPGRFDFIKRKPARRPEDG